MSTESLNWEPGASIEALRARAEMYQTLRDFFAQRSVMEVETPLLSRAGVTDPYLVNATTVLQGPGMPQPTKFYLQTSPEYAMKRLLAANAGAIYQICKVVRDDEIGPLHNPEFSLLEWYRPGFTDVDLMDEVSELLTTVLGTDPATRISYQQAFKTWLDIDPLEQDSSEPLRSILCDEGLDNIAATETSFDTLLQLAMSHLIEPRIGQRSPCFIYDFPASQAALARLDPDDKRVAKRFEVYYQGIELGNGFHELTDAEEQLRRFAHDNLQRKEMGLQPVVTDNRLIQALEHGLPDSAGIAIGLDRLLMLKLGRRSIDEVLTFSISRS